MSTIYFGQRMPLRPNSAQRVSEPKLEPTESPEYLQRAWDRLGARSQSTSIKKIRTIEHEKSRLKTKIDAALEKARKLLESAEKKGEAIQQPLKNVLSLEAVIKNVDTSRQNKVNAFQKALEERDRFYQASKPPMNRILPASPALFNAFLKYGPILQK